MRGVNSQVPLPAVRDSIHALPESGGRGEQSETRAASSSRRHGLGGTIFEPWILIMISLQWTPVPPRVPR